MRSNIGFPYSPITTKEPRIVTFVKKVKLQKLNFYLIFGNGKAVDFVEILEEEKEVDSVKSKNSFLKALVQSVCHSELNSKS